LNESRIENKVSLQILKKSFSASLWCEVIEPKEEQRRVSSARFFILTLPQHEIILDGTFTQFFFKTTFMHFSDRSYFICNRQGLLTDLLIRLAKRSFHY